MSDPSQEYQQKTHTVPEGKTPHLQDAENSFRESGERYRDLIEEIDLGVTMIDPSYTIIMVNQTIVDWVGKPQHLLVGRKCYHEFEQSDGICHNCPGAKVLATGRRQEEIVRWKKSDGSLFHARNKAFPLHDKKGSICGFHELVEDITAKKLAEDRLLTEKNFLDSLVKSLPGVMYLFDETGRFVMWNDILEKVTGYTAAEIKKMSPLDFIASEDRDKVKKAIAKSFQETEAVVEANVLAKDGSETPYHFTGISFRNDSTRYLVGMGIDMSERTRAEEEKEKLIRELREALSRVKLLSGLLPICASCKNIRDDRGYWNKIETYIREHSEAEFTHSICPACARRLYPELTGEKNK